MSEPVALDVSESPPQSRQGSGAGPLSARSAASGLALSALMGAVGPIARVDGHGAPGARAALLLGVGAVGLALSLALVRRRHAWGWVAYVAVSVALVMATSQWVGRTPALFTSAATVITALALGLVADRRSQRTIIVLPVIGGAAFLWAASGTRWAFAVLFVAGCIALVRLDRPQVLGGLEYRAREAVQAAQERLRGEPLLAFVVVAVVAVFTPIFWRLVNSEEVVVRGVNDFQAHYDRVVALQWTPLTLSVPHPGFHLVVKALEVPLGAVAAMTAVEVAAVAVSAVVLYLTARSTVMGARLPGHWAAAFAAMALTIESPAVLVPVGDGWWQRAPGFDQIGRGAGFLNAHVWGSPTISLAAPLYLAIIPLAIRLVQGHPSVARLRWAVAALTTLACLTMPAAALGLAPAAAALVLITGWPGDRSGTRGDAIRRVAWVVVPVVVVCLWQTWFLATSQSPLEEATWRFNPFWLVDYVSMDRPAFWAILVLVLAGASVGGRRYFHDPGVAWTGSATLIAAVPMFLLQETGWKATHGGMAVSFGVCFGLLVVYTVLFLLREIQEGWSAAGARWPRPSLVVAAGVLGLCGVAGALDVISASGLMAEL